MLMKSPISKPDRSATNLVKEKEAANDDGFFEKQRRVKHLFGERESEERVLYSVSRNGRNEEEG